jgi:hypothetical protein
VSVEAASRNHSQHPVFKSNLENNFPEALRCGGIVKQVSTGETTISLIRDKKLEDIISELYPAGPIDQDIWQRAGGDVSRLRLNGTGRAQWFSALRTLKQGGGGENISIDSLMLEVKSDFPNHPSLY